MSNTLLIKPDKIGLNCPSDGVSVHISGTDSVIFFKRKDNFFIHRNIKPIGWLVCGNTFVGAALRWILRYMRVVNNPMWCNVMRYIVI